MVSKVDVCIVTFLLDFYIIYNHIRQKATDSDVESMAFSIICSAFKITIRI